MPCLQTKALVVTPISGDNFLYLLNKRQCFLQSAIFFALERPFSPSKINFRDTFVQNFMWVSPILKAHFEYLYDFIKRGV